MPKLMIPRLTSIGRLTMPGFRLAVALLLLAALAAWGGASRADADQQAVIRLFSLVALLATFWPLDLAPLRARRPLLVAAAAIVALPLLQLVPLPPGLWASLPGHAFYAAIAAASDTVRWRPLTLTPDVTRNALLALIPPVAAGLTVVYLDQRQIVRLYEAILGLAVLSALLGLAQAATGGTAYHLYLASNPDMAPGLFANRNHQAALLACALPLAGVLGGLRSRGRRRLRVGLALLAIGLLLLLGLAATASRMGLVLGVVGLLGAAAGYRATGARAWRLSPRGWLVTGSAIIGGLGVLAAAASRSGVLGRLAASDVASDTRWAALPALWRMVRAFWPTGAGFGAFASIYPQFEPTTALTTIVLNQAHDEVLQVLIEGGLPALALLLAFMGWWLRQATAALRQPVRGVPPALAIAAVAITAILMLSSLVDYPLRTPWLGALFAIACDTLGRNAPVRRHSARRDAANPTAVAT